MKGYKIRFIQCVPGTPLWATMWGLTHCNQISLTLTFALQLASCVTSENFPELSNLPFSHQGSKGNSAVPLGFV